MMDINRVGVAFQQIGLGVKPARPIGTNTFTEGYGGRFGDTGGGVLVEPYQDWIFSVTGIPEPGVSGLLAIAMLLALQRRRVCAENALKMSP